MSEQELRDEMEAALRESVNTEAIVKVFCDAVQKAFEKGLELGMKIGKKE